MWLSLDGPPSRWLATHGKPAAACGRRGLPSYEPEDGEDGLVVFDLLICNHDSVGQVRMLPRSYGVACVVAPDGPVALHHDPDAQWTYRPILYRLNAFHGIEALGSQQELRMRRDLRDTIIWRGTKYEENAAADVRADAILREHLSPLQRIEYVSEGSFRSRGGKTRNVYRIELGNGFQLVSPAGETIATYCLHPEEHIPYADVALATKLWLEDPDAELEALEGARTTVVGLGGKALPAQRFAERLERELIA